MIPAIIKTAEVPSARLELWSDGIMRHIPTQSIPLDMNAVKALTSVMHTLTDGYNVPVMVYLSKMNHFTSDRETRAYLASAEHGIAVRALALIVESPISQVMGNIFLNFNKPAYPTRLFTLEEDAFDWLMQYQNPNLSLTHNGDAVIS